MSFMEFKTWLQKLINRSCNDIYFCISKQNLANNIRRHGNDCDFLDFVCDGYKDGNDLSMIIYVDHKGKPVIDWANQEAVYEEGDEDEGQQLDDDNDSKCFDAELYEHEVEEVPTLNKTVGDAFLHKVSAIPIFVTLSESGPVNAKKYALDEIEGSIVEHCAKLWSYGEELRRSNPGSTIKIRVDVMPDGKTYFSKGQLLAAVGRDANNQIYPLAWAVVAVENKETWKWFVDLLVDDIQMGIRHGLTIISDGHKVLRDILHHLHSYMSSSPFHCSCRFFEISVVIFDSSLFNSSCRFFKIFFFISISSPSFVSISSCHHLRFIPSSSLFHLHVGSVSSPPYLCFISMSAPFHLLLISVSSPRRLRFISSSSPFHLHVGSVSSVPFVSVSSLSFVSVSHPFISIVGSVSSPGRLRFISTSSPFHLSSSPFHLHVGSVSSPSFISVSYPFISIVGSVSSSGRLRFISASSPFHIHSSVFHLRSSIYCRLRFISFAISVSSLSLLKHPKSQGILEAISERVPAAEHRQCARHIYANFRKKFKGEHFRKLLWAVVGSTTSQMFKHHMAEIRVLEPLAYTYLMERDPKSWCKAFFQVDRCSDAYENGTSECFNVVIEEARKRPIMTMLEEIRIYVMTRMHIVNKLSMIMIILVCISFIFNYHVMHDDTSNHNLSH
ncbi:hypothetical protein OSB04_028151 [Centaurea solstitialis]|uniref:MULE transposase domain-containing protein n=1 Tax=Centaurea solstitialis TaxID=347529 RepID=A0AA38SSM5_9ASTR|nr:hypothetical protein OSB04_028151 [Centaurea solstitialis]